MPPVRGGGCDGRTIPWVKQESRNLVPDCTVSRRSRTAALCSPWLHSPSDGLRFGSVWSQHFCYSPFLYQSVWWALKEAAVLRMGRLAGL